MRLAVSQAPLESLKGTHGYGFRIATLFDGLPVHHDAMPTSEPGVTLYQCFKFDLAPDQDTPLAFLPEG